MLTTWLGSQITLGKKVKMMVGPFLLLVFLAYQNGCKIGWKWDSSSSVIGF